MCTGRESRLKMWKAASNRKNLYRPYKKPVIDERRQMTISVNLLLDELDDQDIDRIQALLRSRFKKIDGLQSVVLDQCVQNISLPKFSACDAQKKFVQIINIGLRY